MGHRSAAISCGHLERLRRIADEHAASFRSEGFTTLFATLSEGAGRRVLRAVADHLSQLKFRGRSPGQRRARLRASRVPGSLRGRPTEGGLVSACGDRPGIPLAAGLLTARRARAPGSDRVVSQAINSAANALAQAADHLPSFFTMLRTELGVLRRVPEPAREALAQGRAHLPARRAARGDATALLHGACTTYASRCGPAKSGSSATTSTRTASTGRSSLARTRGQVRHSCAASARPLMMQCGMFVAANSSPAPSASASSRTSCGRRIP